jgi:transcriptional regulator with XRE-family HTH domain
MRKRDRKGEDLKALFSQNIKQYRLASGFSLEEFAEKAEISVPYLCAIERSEKWCSPSVFVKLAHALGLEPHDLLKPESASSREVKKVVSKLAKDISALVNQSVKLLNNIAKEGGPSE